jgi:serine/threonine protein kinase
MASATFLSGPRTGSTDLAVSRVLSAGVRLGVYEVVSLLGQGGMGQVYRATDPNLGRAVAIKVLPERAAADRVAIERFIKEARAASALNHPHIVTIHEIGESEFGRFLVMELIEGRTCGRWSFAAAPLPRL